jgi:ssDNA-binding Zn-finger/Zn-ribbon topoisomerase 1
MTMGPLYKYCPHCKCRYTYNPSVGDLGIFCPYCGKPGMGSIIEGMKRLKKKIFG